MATFGDVWRKVRLQCPDVPPLLIRSWVQDTYQDLCEARGWTWLRRETTLTTAASRSVTVAVTTGSATVTSVGGFVAGDVGRQWRVETWPLYTIVAVPDANTITLDRAYAGTSASTSSLILDAYATLPEDFGRGLMLVDVGNQRQMPFWLTEEDLGRLDPARTQTGSPRVAAAATTSPVPATLGATRWEWWPLPVTALTYPLLYVARPDALLEDRELPGVLRANTNVLESGVLALATRWPGTRDHPNIAFNLGLSQMHQKDYEAGLQRAQLRDDDQVQQSWATYPWQKFSTYALAYDTTILRASDASADGVLLSYW